MDQVLKYVGVFYAALVIVKWFVYFVDTRRLFAIMSASGTRPTSGSFVVFGTVLMVTAAFTMPFTAWYYLMTERLDYFRHVSDEELTNIGIRLAGR